VRSAVSESSPGLCGLIGIADCRTPVLDELREPVRLTVTTEEDIELEREE